MELSLVAENGRLKTKLEKFEIPELIRLANLWGAKPIRKRTVLIGSLLQVMQDIFYIRTILEKLSITQTKLLTTIIEKYPEVMTLGELSKAISLPAKNTEMELNVLQKYSLIYQRKNRERLTNNLDKCYAYREIAEYIALPQKSQINPFELTLAKKFNENIIPTEWENLTKTKASNEKREITNEKIELVFSKAKNLERLLIFECIKQGGIMEMNNVRHFFQIRNAAWEKHIKHLLDLGIILDVHFVADKFIRLIILPQEIFAYFQENPLSLFDKQKKSARTKKRIVCNDLDFFLNIKKLLLYISKRELGLAKSGKIKQIDFRETEKTLLVNNINLFVEKSQIHPIELLLPILHLMQLIRIKGEQIVLKQEIDKVMSASPLEFMEKVCDTLRKKRMSFHKVEQIFKPQYVVYPHWQTLVRCMDSITKQKEIAWFILLSHLIRESLMAEQIFDFKILQEKYDELKKEISGALFYLQLFGFINVQFPDRMLSISELGEYVFYNKPFSDRVEKGGIILNSDMSLIAIPEKLSLHALTSLKGFAKIENYENVYTFSLSKEYFQEGLLLKESKEKFIGYLSTGSKQKMSNSLLFQLDDWSTILPIIQITDDCVLVQTKKNEHMKLLLGNIQTKKILVQKLSDNSIIIDSGKISELIQHCEKLNLIVKLTK